MVCNHLIRNSLIKGLCIKLVSTFPGPTVLLQRLTILFFETWVNTSLILHTSPTSIVACRKGLISWIVAEYLHQAPKRWGTYSVTIHQLKVIRLKRQIPVIVIVLIVHTKQS